MTLRRPVVRYPKGILGDLTDGDSNVVVPRNGTISGRPAAGDVLTGELYFSTDEGKLYRSTGSTWEEIGGGGGGGGGAVWRTFTFTGADVKALPAGPGDSAPPNNLTARYDITLAAKEWIRQWKLDITNKLLGDGVYLTLMYCSVGTSPTGGNNYGGMGTPDVMAAVTDGYTQIGVPVQGGTNTFTAGGGDPWYVKFSGSSAIGNFLQDGGSLTFRYEVVTDP